MATQNKDGSPRKERTDTERTVRSVLGVMERYGKAGEVYYIRGRDRDVFNYTKGLAERNLYVTTSRSVVVMGTFENPIVEPVIRIELFEIDKDKSP